MNLTLNCYDADRINDLPTQLLRLSLLFANWWPASCGKVTSDVSVYPC